MTSDLRLLAAFTSLLLFGCADASETDETGPSVGAGGKADEAVPCCELDEMEPDTACCADGSWAANCKDGTAEVCDDADPVFDPNAEGGEGDACGSLLHPLCGEGLFCMYPPEANCGRADDSGTCRVVPSECIQVDDPVCGCDGMTYSNACIAESQGRSWTPGACELPIDPDDRGSVGDPCGSLLTPLCEEGLFCKFAVQMECNGLDEDGTCAEPPQLCPEVYSPVCGCDGEDYSNPCFADAAEVRYTQGPCE